LRQASVWAAIALEATASALAACAPTPPSMAACMNDSAADQARIGACTAAIREGAQGEALADAYRQRGRAYTAVGEAARAVQDLTEAIRLNPGDDAAFAARAAAREALGDTAAAREDESQAVGIRPSPETYVARATLDNELHDYDAGIADAAKAIALKSDWPNAWSAQGYAYLGKGEYEVALADFASALRLDPQFINAVDGRAAAFRAKHDYEAALAVCTDAIRADPKNIWAFACRADTYDAQGDYAAALADYGQAIATDPGQAWLYQNRSGVYLDAGDGSAAIADADKGLALAPRDPSALNAACWARAVADTRLAEARTDCQRSLAIRPHDGATIDSLAMVYFRMGRLADSLVAYNAALAADSTYASSRFMRGVVKRRLGDAAGAAADLAAAEKSDPAIAKRYAGYGVTP
jgi:tetratricopeptide (TPR) repeat protein